MIEGKKAAYPHIFNGSEMKIKPGDRGGDIRKSYRYGCLMRREFFIKYKTVKNLSIKNIMIITGKSKSTVQGWLGTGQSSKNRSISKYDFWKIVEAVEPPADFAVYKPGDLSEVFPADIELVLQFSVRTA